MANNKVRLGAACIEYSTDKSRNFESISRLVKQASKEGVDFLAFPECAIQGYPLGLGPPRYDVYEGDLREAETVPGPTTENIIGLAKEYGIELVFGLTEIPSEKYSAGQLFNTVVFVDGSGVLGKYRKIHTGSGEKIHWNRGRAWTLVDSKVGKVGLMICYDIVFPETARCLALGGSDILVMSTAWTTDEILKEGYDLFTRVRALENQVFLISSNFVGGPSQEFYGHSRIVSPNGAVIAESTGVGIAIAEVDVDEDLLEARSHGWYGQVFLKDREPSTYSPLVMGS